MNLGLLSGLLSLKQAKDTSTQAVRAAASEQALASRQASLAEEQWARYQRIYDPLEEESAARARRALGYLSDLQEAQAGDLRADIALYAPLKRARAADEAQSLAEFAPLRSRLVAQAMTTARPDYAGAEGLASADARAALDRARAESRRRALGYGLTPDRLASAAQGGVGDLDQAALEVAARSRARQAERERAAAQDRQNVSLALQARGEASALPKTSLVEPQYRLSNGSAALGLFDGAQSGLAKAASGLASLAGAAQRGALQGLGSASLGDLF